MSRISPKDLEPGMKTARAVENKSGLVMIGENTELTASLIEKIRSMDIPSVYVHGAAKALQPKEEILSGIDSRFKNVEAEPYMGVIKKAVVEHIESLYEDHGLQNPEG
jgi:hypothetical protein